MYKESDRYANFGPCIVKMHVYGFRCHSSTVFQVHSPITAFCGLNGSGKSTLLHLAACAYKEEQQAYYIPDFLKIGPLDPSPFTDDAWVEFNYWNEDRKSNTVTISRRATESKWGGYSRRPDKHVFFLGAGSYIPKIEQRDFIFQNSSELKIEKQQALELHVKEKISKILEIGYDSVFSNTVSCLDKSGTVVSVNRYEACYSEFHMGYGEGRTQHLVSNLEILPERSLVLIEEPETSLHPIAEFELGRYLINVSCRRKHQILITTHSESLLAALPEQSRIYLKRGVADVKTVSGLSALQIKSLMSNGFNKALYILVEDICAKAVLQEIIRRIDPDFLKAVEIVEVGDKKRLTTTVQTLNATSIHVAGVRDADAGAVPSENIFSLPGSEPPERELFKNKAVIGMLGQDYDLNFNDFLTSLSGVDHHHWINVLAKKIDQDQGALLREMSRAYAKNLPETDAVTLTNLLKETSKKRVAK